MHKQDKDLHNSYNLHNSITPSIPSSFTPFDGYKVLGRCRGCGHIFTFKGVDDFPCWIDIYGTPFEVDLATGCVECAECGGFWAFDTIKVVDWISELFWTVKGK